jgi:hypothetical protein
VRRERAAAVRGRHAIRRFRRVRHGVSVDDKTGASMNVSEFTCIALGMIFNVLTFVLGCSVGVTLAKRKDSTDGNRYEGFRYYPEDSEK